jgi:DNA-directed RNA polymerase specialized sigma24 family protein
VRSTLELKLSLHEAIPVSAVSADSRRSPYVRGARYRPLLHFVANRVLDSAERAAIAVENCLFSASQHAPVFDCEGAFRSWLARIAIDEALAIRHERSSGLLPKLVFGMDERGVCESKEAENVAQIQNRATDRRATRLEYLPSSSVLRS